MREQAWSQDSAERRVRYPTLKSGDVPKALVGGRRPPLPGAHRPPDHVLLWLPANELLKTRIVPNRIPFPSVFQIVNRDAVVDAIHRSRRFQKSLD
jgi:hypothetical protein